MKLKELIQIEQFIWGNFLIEPLNIPISVLPHSNHFIKRPNRIPALVRTASIRKVVVQWLSLLKW